MPGSKKHKGGASKKVRKTTIALAGTSGGRREAQTRVLGPGGREAERKRTQALVDQETSILTDQQLQVLTGDEFASSPYVMDNGYVLHVDADNDTGGPGDGNEWSDEGTEVYIGDLHESARSPWKAKLIESRVTWSERRRREMSAWEGLFPALTEGFLEFLSRSAHSDRPASPMQEAPVQSSNTSSGDLGAHPGGFEPFASSQATAAEASAALAGEVPYTLKVYDLFVPRASISIKRSQDSTSAALDLIRFGWIAKTPVVPEVAVSVRTLELLYRLRQRKPNLSIEAFAKVVCDAYKQPFRRFMRDVFADTFEIYLRILRIVDHRIRNVLGWDGPEWRIKNSCTACSYKLEGEPEFKFDRLVCMDGNNSLKRMKTFKGRTAADTRLLEDPRYFLSRDYVDRFSKEVRGKKAKLKAPRVPAVRLDTTEPIEAATLTPADDYDDNSDAWTEASAEGDPTDGPDTLPGESDGATELKRRAIEACVKNWKAAAADEKKSMWDIFDESGIFAAACRHGLLLVLVDMVRSGELAKYPLAVLNKLLEVLDGSDLYYYDIGCKFHTTANNSQIVGPLFRRQKANMCVPSFHGYTHCFTCQMVFHPNIIEGTGLEDGETMERMFSSSNALAPVVRFASTYRRQLMIETYFNQVDEDKYLASGTFILNNMIQANDIIKHEPALLKTLNDLHITEEKITRWQEEEINFFASLSDKAPYDIHEVAYVESLQELWETERERSRINTRWSSAAASASYDDQFKAGRAKETKRRQINQALVRLQNDVIEMEVQLGIAENGRWTPAHPKFQETARFIAHKNFHDALEHLQRLVILRMFELHKLNIAQTGYKMRSHIADSLQKRSKAIRNAIARYNKAADSMTPPARHVNWDQVSKFAFIEEFTLLHNTHNDLRDKEWTDPLKRDVIKQYNWIKHAREELVRCQVETRRLHTAIRDERVLFNRILGEMSTSDPLYVPLKDFCERRQQINNHILSRIEQIYALPWYSGIKGPGTRLGSIALTNDESLSPTGESPSTEARFTTNSRADDALESLKITDPRELNSGDEAEDEEEQMRMQALSDWAAVL